MGHRREVGGKVRVRWLGAAVGGYVGINAAAVCDRVQARDSAADCARRGGACFERPYPLTVAMPAMAISHLLVVGFVEAIVTGLVIAYLQKADPGLILGLGEKVGGEK